jgi:hypothetical protein
MPWAGGGGSWGAIGRTTPAPAAVVVSGAEQTRRDDLPFIFSRYFLFLMCLTIGTYIYISKSTSCVATLALTNDSHLAVSVSICVQLHITAF